MKIAVVGAGAFFQNARGDPGTAQENDGGIVIGYSLFVIRLKRIGWKAIRLESLKALKF